MTELKTTETLLSALREAATRKLSEAEIKRQRISFILGSVGDKSTVTKDQVTEILAQHEGREIA